MQNILQLHTVLSNIKPHKINNLIRQTPQASSNETSYVSSNETSYVTSNGTHNITALGRDADNVPTSAHPKRNISLCERVGYILGIHVAIIVGGYVVSLTYGF